MYDRGIMEECKPERAKIGSMRINRDPGPVRIRGVDIEQAHNGQPGCGALHTWLRIFPGC